jgi:hypothetical protein
MSKKLLLGKETLMEFGLAALRPAVMAEQELPPGFTPDDIAGASHPKIGSGQSGPNPTRNAAFKPAQPARQYPEIAPGVRAFSNMGKPLTRADIPAPKLSYSLPRLGFDALGRVRSSGR